MLNQPISADTGQAAAGMPAGFIAEPELGDPRIRLPAHSKLFLLFACLPHHTLGQVVSQVIQHSSSQYDLRLARG